MTTPKDVARMLSGFSMPPQRASEYISDQADHLHYFSLTQSESDNAFFTSESDGFNHPIESSLSHSLQAVESFIPSPAMMPKKRLDNDSPATFASLDAHELPVVREYSAGGLIFNDKDEVAIIARHSRSGHLEWCLPKGHIEKGETPEETAIREVHEETGILGSIFGSIATIDYWFTGETQRVHKLVHHYVLHQISGSLTVEGDPDHEAEDAAWVNFTDLTSILSYPNERRIVWLYARKYHRH